MAIGRYDAEVVRLAAALGAAVSNKVAETLELNPLRTVFKTPLSEEDQKKESRRALRMMVRGLKTMVQHGG